MTKCGTNMQWKRVRLTMAKGGINSAVARGKTNSAEGGKGRD